MSEVDSAYQVWSERAREKYAGYRSREESSALDSIRAWADRNPLTVSMTFDNEAGPDFSRIFEEAPVIEGTPDDSARLKDYAMHLRDLISSRDGPGLYREIRPAKNAAYRKQEQSPPRDSVRQAKWVRAAEKGTGWFQGVEEKTVFNREQIGVRSWVGKRVWELYRKPGDALFGGWKIYVAELNGELRVVRLE